MPAEVWVALIGFGGIVLGYFIRPIGELTGEIVRDRRAKSARRAQFQFDTLVAISEALESWGVSAATTRPGGAAAVERIRVLAFRVRDDQLRSRLTGLNSSSDEIALAAARVRLGEVLRDL